MGAALGFTYASPKTQPELLDLLAAEGANARVLAGGTDLLLSIRDGDVAPRVVADLKGVAGHADVRWSAEGGLLIGPAVTVNALAADETVRRRYPLLVEAAAQLASHALRNRATVVGNVCNASPCADMAPALLCLGARVRLASKAGRRAMPLAELFAGPKATRIRPGEYCERIEVPAETAGGRGGYLKLKRLKGHDLALVSVALFRFDGVLRAAVGSAAPTPILLAEMKPSARPADVARAVRKAVAPIDDLRASAEYRRHVAGVFAERLARSLSGRRG